MLAVQPPGSYASIFIWSGVLIGLVVVAYVGYALFVRWMKSDAADEAVGFTLSSLRESHRRGEMSTEEYERIRGNMVAAAKKMTDRLPDVNRPREPKTRSDDLG